MKNLDKKYGLVSTGADVVFIGKRNSKNFIERKTGIHGDWAVAYTAACRAGVTLPSNFTNEDLMNSFDALQAAAKFVG